MLKQIHVQMYPPERPQWHGDIKKHWRFSPVFIANFDKIPHFLFIISLLNLGKCCWLLLPAVIKVQTNKNYETCKQRYKLCNINETGQSTTWKETRIVLKCMQTVGFQQTSTKFIEIFVP